MRLNRKIRATLAATLVLTLVALWLDTPSQKVVTPVNTRGGAGSPDVTSSRDLRQIDRPSTRNLPEHWTRDELAVAAKDPFARVAAAPVPPPPPITPSSLPASPPPAPVPPPNARYAGSLIDPDGVRHVFLWSGSRQMAAEPGLELESGHVVQSVGAEMVVLTYPGSDTTVSISIPPPVEDPEQIADAGASQ